MATQVVVFADEVEKEVLYTFFFRHTVDVDFVCRRIMENIRRQRSNEFPLYMRAYNREGGREFVGSF